jgi:hypothetical protein
MPTGLKAHARLFRYLGLSGPFMHSCVFHAPIPTVLINLVVWLRLQDFLSTFPKNLPLANGRLWRKADIRQIAHVG